MFVLYTLAAMGVFSANVHSVPIDLDSDSLWEQFKIDYGKQYVPGEENTRLFQNILVTFSHGFYVFASNAVKMVKKSV